MRKRIAFMVLCVAILLTALFGVSGAAFAEGKDFSIIRVVLSVPSSCTQVQFYVDGNYSVDGLPLARDLYTAKIQSGNVRLYRANESDPVISASGSIRLIQHTPTEGRNNFIWHDNSRNGWCAYLGDMQIRNNSGKIQLINHLYIEEYLYGVVPHEMSNSFPLEALKAQAVSARTYAVNKIAGAKSTALYDINDTSGHQVYKGFTPSYTRAKQAVDETKGLVLKCGSKYVDVYYAASNGGWTDIPQHIWTATAKLQPYHVIQEDPYDIVNPSSRQDLIVFPKTISSESKIEYSSGTVSNMKAPDDVLQRNANAELLMKKSALSAVRKKGYIAEKAADIEILGFSKFVTHTHDTSSSQKHGGTDKYDGNDYNEENMCPDFTKADVTMTVNACRYATTDEDGGLLLGDVNGSGDIDISDYTNLRLHILDLRTLDDNALLAADVNRDGEITISDYTLLRLHILDLKPISGTTTGAVVKEPVTVTFTIDMHQLHSDGDYPVYSTTNLRLLIVEETDDKLSLYRRRYGHGLGLSQRGAQQRAKDVKDGGAGQNYEEIMLFYYPGTQIAEEASIRPPGLSDLSDMADETNAAVNCSSSPLNVRNGPSTNDKAIGKLPNKARISVIEQNVDGSGWHRIGYGNYQAFVSASYVLLDNPK